MPIITLRRLVCVVATIIALSLSGLAQQPPASSNNQLMVPLTMTETQDQTFKAMISLGVGSLQPLPITLDTGSVGLVLFAVPGIPGNGTTCDGSFSVSFGSPKRVTYSGLLCSGPISLAGVISTPSIQFGLLTTLTFCAPNATCQTPTDNYHAGIFGVFGVGITPGQLPNPLRTLPGAYGQSFLLRLTPDTSVLSSLILAPVWRFDAAVFPQGAQSPGALNMPTYDKGVACLLLNGSPNTACPAVSFDTGNGVPWFHTTIPGVLTNTPVVDGPTYVASGQTIGVTPRQGGPAAFTFTAGNMFADEFRYEFLTDNLINVGIQAFFGNDVIFDGEQGLITVAPTNSPVAAN